MLYTTEWVLEKYAECNQKYFNGELPALHEGNLKITVKKNPWGRGGCKGFRRDPWTGEYHAHGVYLELSNYYDTCEHDKLEILVHEMCHIYEYFCEPKWIIDALLRRKWTKEHPSNGHGLIFYREARRLEQYGFHVQRYVDSELKANAVKTDVAKKKEETRASRGYLMFQLKYESPERSSTGRYFDYGHAIVPMAKHDDWADWFRRVQDTYATRENRVKYSWVVCLTTYDPKILNFTMRRSVGRHDLDMNLDAFKDIEFVSKEIIIGNPEPEVQPELKVHKIPLFRMKTQKDGVVSVFEVKDVTKEELIQKIKERFPKWSDASVERVINTPSYFPLGESKNMETTKYKIDEEDIKKMVEEALDQITDPRKRKLGRKNDMLPDELPGNICDN